MADPTPPESIEVSLDLIGKEGLDDLQKALTSAQSLLQGIQKTSNPGNTYSGAPNNIATGTQGASVAQGPTSEPSAGKDSSFIPFMGAAPTPTSSKQTGYAGTSNNVTQGFQTAGPGNDQSLMSQGWQAAQGAPVVGPALSTAGNLAGKAYNLPLGHGQTLGTTLSMGTVFGLAQEGIGGAVNTALGTAMSATPWNAASQGASYGLGAGTNIGPVQVGGPGATEVYSNLLNSVQAGMAPGSSFQGQQTFNQALEEMGWHGGMQNQMADVRTNLISSLGNENALPGGPQDPGQMASMMDQWIRNGSGSLKEFQQTMSELPTTAAGAAMGITEFSQAVDEVANTLQQSGLTYPQGFQAAQSFSGATHMDPRVLPQLMQNPFLQANIMGTYGLLPQQQGLLAQDTGAMTGSIESAIQQQRKIYAGSFQGTKGADIRIPGGGTIPGANLSAKQKEDSMIANNLGMTVDQLHRFQRNRQQYQVGANIDTAATQYQGEVAQLRRTNKYFNNGQWTREGDAALHKLNTQGIGGKASWQDVMKLAESKGSPLTKSQIEHMQANPQDRASYIRQLVAKSHQAYGGQGPNSGQKVNIDLTPWAKKLVQEYGQGASATSDAIDARKSRAGGGPLNTHSVSPVPTGTPPAGQPFYPGPGSAP